ncbi:hypothetical protein MNEG_8414 [Monoraphidium neglectum]|uniref:Protein kinase domain-containing protein n=1 Tax=Monoraphidium neglectum TaxID=145388 RepID=A0A0D2MZK7_9CHLO|nr:hypothetical protein MNEG_8414 [Monoraphidium neglectum]KIY99550.1 hypothetical protein MNEG_8414 [Monoraphidium neglectum]|eukprot:XP_013898570.1 hypothetical protein MNEG_8414 [Monoraphidium neglectum]
MAWSFLKAAVKTNKGSREPVDQGRGSGMAAQPSSTSSTSSTKRATKHCSTTPSSNTSAALKTHNTSPNGSGLAIITANNQRQKDATVSCVTVVANSSPQSSFGWHSGDWGSGTEDTSSAQSPTVQGLSGASSPGSTTVPPSPSQPQTSVPTHAQVELEFCLSGAAQLFNKGTPLGIGAQGEVRQVKLLGHHYALKRELGIFSSEYGVDTVGGPWVQKCITSDVGMSPAAHYSLFELAPGSLTDALEGHAWAAAAAAADKKIGVSGAPAVAGRPSAKLSQHAASPDAKPQVPQGAHTKSPPLKRLINAFFRRGKKESQAQQQQQQQQPAEPYLPIPAAKALAAELITAVGTVHAAGIVHRDIKPDNLLVAADGHLRLCNFGCAAPASEPALGEGGTPLFMAPEHFVDFDSFWGKLSFDIRVLIKELTTRLGFKHDSRPADMWAMGVTLSAMLLPLPEVTAALAAARVGKKWVPAPGSAAAALPAELRDLLFRGMLARRPRRRLTVAQLKGHAFFAGVDWAAVEARAAPLPIDLVALARRGREAAASAAAAAAPSPAAAVPGAST